MLRHHLFHSVIAAIVLLAAACAAPAPQSAAPPAATAAPAAAAAPTKAPAAAAPAATAAPTKAPAAPNAAPTPLSPVVAILVVDSFDNDPAQTPRPKDWKPSEKEYCLATPDGQGYRSDGATASPIGTTPHGWLVYKQILSLLGANTATPVAIPTSVGSTAPPWRKDVAFRKMLDGSGYVLLMAVHIQGFNTQAAAKAIKDAMASLKPLKIQGAVINMSFAIVPCPDGPSTPAEYSRMLSQDAKVEELRKLLAKIYVDNKFRDAIGPGGSDPLYTMLKDPPTLGQSGSTISMAAAGNSGTKDLKALDFPFAPALWPEVLSVSASGSASAATDPLDVTSQNKATYSNSGEVMVSGVNSDKTNEGTSFAAPKLAYLTARYLLTCKSNCNSRVLKNANKSANNTLQVAATPYPPFPTTLP
jgi:hypothetical protein